jgi:hypothetical protein
MRQLEPIAVKIPMIMQSTMILEIVISPNDTAQQLCRRLGVYHPSTLCRWPWRVRLLPGENVYELVEMGESLYIVSKDAPDIARAVGAQTCTKGGP